VIVLTMSQIFAIFVFCILHGSVVTRIRSDGMRSKDLGCKFIAKSNSERI